MGSGGPLSGLLTQHMDSVDVDQKLKRLDEQLQQKLWMAQRWREHSLRNLEHSYASQLQQARDEYECERQELLAAAAAASSSGTVMEGSRSKGGRHQSKLHNGGGVGRGEDGGGRAVRTSSRRRTRQQTSAEMVAGGAAHDGHALGGHAAQQQGKLRNMSLPVINYTLTEDEIVEDLSIICNRLGTFTTEMKRLLFQEAQGLPLVETLPQPPGGNLQHNISLPLPSFFSSSPLSSMSLSSPPSSSLTSAETAASLSPSATSVSASLPASPPRTSAFAHKLIGSQQQDPFAAPS